jgi:hypothetical protein
LLHDNTPKKWRSLPARSAPQARDEMILAMAIAPPPERVNANGVAGAADRIPFGRAFL